MSPLASTGFSPLTRTLLAGALLSVIAPPVLAFDFSSGELTGSFDTTVTAGVSFRVQDADPKNIGFANGGTRWSVNGDDGNLNYDTGLFSAAFRATHELALDYRNFGVFVRGTYFYDLVNDSDESTDFRDLPDETVERIGRDIELLDAFLTMGFDIAERPLDLRIGNQVISWGESTFIQNGINVINPVDVSAIRVPGSELREALRPQPIASFSIDPIDNLTIEGFYQFRWDETEIDPSGSFFSTNDFASPGGRFAFLGFGQGGPIQPGPPNADGSFGIPDNPELAISRPTGFYGASAIGAVVPRDRDRDADDDGQFGAALRYYSSTLFDTEFGLYFINYHSRLPLIAGSFGTLPGLLGIGDPNYAASASYRIDYPEDIKLYGASFNTLLPNGTSLQGEISFRVDQPLQLDDVEILQAASAPGGIRAAASAGAAGGEAQARATPGFDMLPPETQAQIIAGGRAAGELQAVNQVASLFAANQIIQQMGGIAVDPSNAANTLASSDRFFGTEVLGYRGFDTMQMQFTATHSFGPIRQLGIDQWILLGELGWTHVFDFPDPDVLLLEGPNTPLPGTATGALLSGVPQQQGGFATQNSVGYVIAAQFRMLNAIGPINLIPSVSFRHDIEGTSPSPIANFIENRAAINVGVEATYLNQWSAQIGYTNFFAIGDNEFNLSNDRDFVSISLSYSF